MNAQDAFGVAVRTMGLFVSIYGVWLVAYGFAMVLGRGPADEKHKPFDYLVWGVAGCAAGLMLMRAAPLIVDFAYQ